MQYLEFYRKYLPNINTSTRKQNVLCPFHDDKTPSMSIDLEEGLYYCHACKEGGDTFQFYMKFHNCSFAKAKNDIMGNEQFNVLTDTEVNEAHKRLLESPHLQKLLLVKRGWSLETIKKYELGWSEERVFIPIRSSDGSLQNIRKYDIFHKTKQKFKGVEGYNQIRLWPRTALEKELLVICAGEPDTLLACQYGINACTFTGAEGTFRQELLPEFKDKTVYIVYDVDEPGRIGARRLANKLIKYAKDTFIVNLPKKLLPKNGDFTDLVFWCTDNDKSLTSIWNPLVELAEKIEKPIEVEEKYEEVDFYSAVKENYYNRNIQFKAIAIGKNLSPFFAPRRISAQCNFTRGDTCKSCILFATGGQYNKQVSEIEALDLIKCTNNEQQNRIRNLIGIQKCSQFKLEIESQTIEEIFFSPVIDSERVDRQFILRKGYTQSHNLQINKTYNLLGKTISDPRTQEATHLFSEQKPELSDLETFTLSDIDKQVLKVFQPEEDSIGGIKKK